jgi:DNA-binding Lrp family transcriptional regulator
LKAAFVLITAEVGSEIELKTKLLQLPHVVEAYAVCGVYDIIAKVEAETMDGLKEVMTQEIRCLDEVHSTLTMVVMEPEHANA